MTKAEAIKSRLVSDDPTFKPCITFLYGGMFIVGTVPGYYVGTFDDKTKLLKIGLSADLDAAFDKPREQTEPIPADYEPPF